MPHKDRETRLAYLRRWKLEHRPAPQEQPQADAALPPRGRVVFSTDGTRVQCHSCGEWFGSLNTHLKMHGLNARSYKELYGLARGASLLPPVTADRYRDAALARDQGAVGREHIPLPQPRPRGLEQRLSVRVEASEARSGEMGHTTSRHRSDPKPHPSEPNKYKAAWSPERRAAQAEIMRQRNKRPDFVAVRDKRASEEMTLRHKDPKFAAAHVERLRRRRGDMTRMDAKKERDLLKAARKERVQQALLDEKLARKKALTALRKEVEARNNDILNAALKGESLSSLGQNYGLSRQRVHQIVHRALAFLRARPMIP